MPRGQLSPRAADTETFESTACALQQGSHREQKASRITVTQAKLTLLASRQASEPERQGAEPRKRL